MQAFIYILGQVLKVVCQIFRSEFYQILSLIPKPTLYLTRIKSIYGTI